MIWKVLKTEISATQLSAAFMGAFAGLVIMLAAAGFYVDVIGVFDDNEGFWKEEYIIISKRITSDETLRQINEDVKNKPIFSKQEIDELCSKSFVKQVTPFSNCTFGVAAFTGKEGPMAGFYTDMFFEAVPREYIDVNYEGWSWKEGDSFIPVIIPKTYLNLYNFGFATTQNLPQVSEKSASLVKFNVLITGKNQRKKFEARIIGFSDRINTILVPKEFIEWGNKNFGDSEIPDPNRVIVVANDPSNPEMFRYFEKQGFDVNKSELSNSKALMFLRIIISMVISVGLLITALAFWLMITSIMLLLQKNKNNILKLKLLGYHPEKISRPYYLLSLVMIGAIALLSVIPLYFIRSFYTGKMLAMGYESAATYTPILALLMLSFVIALLLICLISIRIRVRQFIK
ncbi:MAG TPA: ABC transporter permease [Bacteroidales bacterium]|nr:ABC transporter permease [Bacteroidales bacterium]